MSKPFSNSRAAADKVQPPAGAHPADDIRRQLERILASAQFRESLRLTRFLGFVVEATLAGRADSIKAYTIAVEAMGRGSDFDPQGDPIVRVEAGRLRQALARYYAGEGRDDPFTIDLPLGRYVPNFRRRDTATPLPQNGNQNSAPASTTLHSMPRHQGGVARQINHRVFESFTLVKAQRGQITEFSVALDSVKQTLSVSRDLLKSGAQLASGYRQVLPQALHHAEVAELLAAAENGSAEPDAPAPEKDIAKSTLGPRPELPTGRPKRKAGSFLTRAASRAHVHSRITKIAFAAIAVLAILEVLFDIDHPLVGGPNHGLVEKYILSSAATGSPARGSGGAPTIYVEPVAAVGQPFPGLLQPKMVREHLVDALARYDDVTVVDQAPQAASTGAVNASESAGAPSSLYRLASTVRYAATGATLTVRLIDTANASIAWSKQYEHPSDPHQNHKNGLIASDVARSLLDPFGVIQARERINLATVDPMVDTYRCLLDAAAYLRSFDPSQYRPVRDCLVSASERAPPDATVFADLAFIYLRNYRFGIGSLPGEPVTLDNAYAAAARAVDIKPESAFTQYALGAVLLAKGDIERAKIASDKSYRLNPYNGAVAFGHAAMLILTGEIDAGLALLDENGAKQPINWIGYHLLKALGCYLKGDLKTAFAESRQIANPFFPPGLMLDALVANKAGDRARAQQDIAMLYQFYPAWREHFRASIGRYLPEDAMADRIAADFKAAAAGTMQ
jgi:tetratricopeptide (TPR) repeat protein